MVLLLNIANQPKKLMLLLMVCGVFLLFTNSIDDVLLNSIKISSMKFIRCNFLQLIPLISFRTLNNHLVLCLLRRCCYILS